MRPSRITSRVFAAGFAAATIFLFACAAWAAPTAKQIDALAERVGKTYWTIPADNRALSVLSAPSAQASSFRAPADESFEVSGLVGQKTPNPYYKIKFSPSGKEGFIASETFLDELNVRILSVDPKADEKRKTAAAAEQERQRVEWIQSQPWSQAVKAAAVKKQVLSGMSTGEVKKVLGNPTRTSRIRGPQAITEEQWFYPNGNVLIFQNGLLSRVETPR